MKIYYFSDTEWKQKLRHTKSELTEIFNQIANGTNTDMLVVATYLLGKSSSSGGIAFARDWLTDKQFLSFRGRWKFTQEFSIPHDIPETFKLIRLHFGIKNSKYPLCQIDRYGWKLTYSSFRDHLAFLFAHELHHYRRYHLRLHHGEGENSANRWALYRLNQLNFQIEGFKLPRGNKKKNISRLVQQHIIFDPYKKYRSLHSGDKLLIKYDPRGHYQGEIVAVVRPIRKNSRRIVVETADGKLWRWPLEWIAIVR